MIQISDIVSSEMMHLSKSLGDNHPKTFFKQQPGPFLKSSPAMAVYPSQVPRMWWFDMKHHFYPWHVCTVHQIKRNWDLFI